MRVLRAKACGEIERAPGWACVARASVRSEQKAQKEEEEDEEDDDEDEEALR